MSSFEFQIAGHSLYNILAIVEHPLYRDVVDVVVLQAEHLSLLKGAHPPVGRHHEDPHPFLTAHRVFCRAPSVATGRPQNVQFLMPARQFATARTDPASDIPR